MIDVKEMLAEAIKNEASDVHVNIEMPPIMRINTELSPMDFPVMDEKGIMLMLEAMVGPDKVTGFLEKRDLDFSTKIDDGSRFRVNARFQRESPAISFRVISNNIPSLEGLHLPQIVNDLIDLPRGLVLVTGHTGSGKSTTLASMVNAINCKYSKRIITLEDPIEYALENDKCMIEQREIGSDCMDFASGLKHVLRQDPDIILVGEMRDLETTSSTITGAETGHLVFSTLHTTNASQTVERIIDIYPAAQQNQIRAMLANTLQAVISQTLLAKKGGGRTAAREIMVVTSAVSSLIREGKTHQIYGQLQTGSAEGMVTLEMDMARLLNRDIITYDVALGAVNDVKTFLAIIEHVTTEPAAQPKSPPAKKSQKGAPAARPQQRPSPKGKDAKGSWWK